MGHKRSAPVVLQVEDGAVSCCKRLEVGDAKSEAADRATLDLHIEGLLRRAFECFFNGHMQDGRDEAIAEIVVAPGRRDRGHVADDDLIGAARAFARGNVASLCVNGWLDKERDRANHDARTARAPEKTSGKHRLSAVKSSATLPEVPAACKLYSH